MVEKSIDSSDESKEKQFYTSISHEIRRKIIKIIGDKDSAGFSDIKKGTNISTGTIYHHLNVVKDLIAQDSRKKYHLTTLGQHAYRFLSQNLDSIKSVEANNTILVEQKTKKISNFLLFKKVFKIVLENQKWAYLTTPLILLLIAGLCGVLSIDAYLFFYEKPSLDEKDVILDFNSSLMVISGFIILFLLTELLCQIIFGKKDNWLGLLKVLGISYIPILFYLLILVNIIYLIPLNHRDILIINRILMLCFQVWSMVLLAYSISLTKYVRLERGLIIAIFIDYGTFMTLLLSGQPLPF